MIHECRVQCHTIDIRTAETLGLEDAGKWLPFIFSMEIVDAAKMASDDVTSTVYDCTTIFCSSGESYIIDTPYLEFFQKFSEYHSLTILPDDPAGDDLDL